MNHAYIEEHSLVDRYLQGSLEEEERGAFEEHFVDCQSCLTQLESARGLRDGLLLTARPLSTSHTPNKFGPWLGFAVAACLLASVSSTIFYYQKFERAAKSLQTAERMNQTPPLLCQLSQTRGLTTEANHIHLPANPRWLIFEIPADTSQFSNFRAHLSDNATGNRILNLDPLQPASPDTLTVSLLSNALHKGNFILVLEGSDKTGAPEPLATFPLKVE